MPMDWAAWEREQEAAPGALAKPAESWEEWEQHQREAMGIQAIGVGEMAGAIRYEEKLPFAGAALEYERLKNVQRAAEYLQWVTKQEQAERQMQRQQVQARVYGEIKLLPQDFPGIEWPERPKWMDDKRMVAGRERFDYPGGKEKAAKMILDYVAELEDATLRGKTFGAEVYEGIVDLIPYAVEFAVSGGMAAPVKSGVGRAGMWALRKYGTTALRKTLIKGGTRGAAWIATAAARTAIMTGRVAAGKTERELAGQSPVRAFWNALSDTFIENLSEVTGASMGRAAARGARIAGLGGLATRIDKSLRRVWLATGRRAALYEKVLATFGYDGILWEMGEERFGDALRGAIGQDDMTILDAIPSGRQLAVEAGIFAAPMLGGTAAASLASLTDAQRARLSDIANLNAAPSRAVFNRALGDDASMFKTRQEREAALLEAKQWAVTQAAQQAMEASQEQPVTEAVAPEEEAARGLPRSEIEAARTELETDFPGSIQFIEQQVRQSGSTEAVARKYGTDSAVDRYARAFAAEVYAAEPSPEGPQAAERPAEARRPSLEPAAEPARPEAPITAEAAPEAAPEAEGEAGRRDRAYRAATMAELDEMLDRNEIDAGAHEAMSYLLSQVAPNTPIDVLLRTYGAERDATDADRLLDLQTEGALILGETRTAVRDGRLKALIDFYQGHDAETAAHEWAHAYLDAVKGAAAAGNQSAKALLDAYRTYHARQADELSRARDKLDPDRPMDERFAREFADGFLRRKPHKTGRLHRIHRAISRLVERLRDALRRVFGSDSSASKALIEAGMEPVAARRLFATKGAKIGAAAAANRVHLQAAPRNAMEQEQEAQRAANQILDRNLADKQEAYVRAEVDAANLQDELVEAVGKKAAPEHAAAMLLHIDLIQSQEEQRGTPEDIWRRWAQQEDSQLDTPAHRRLFDLSQNLPPAVQAITDRLLALSRNLGQIAVAGGIIQQAKLYYAPRLWERENVSYGPHGGYRKTTARAKPRTYESILQGWAYGETLAVPDAITAVMLARQEVAQAMFGRKLLEEGLAQGTWTTDAKAARPLGWRQVDVKGFDKYMWTGSVIPALAKVETMDELREKYPEQENPYLEGLQARKTLKAMEMAETEALPPSLQLPQMRDAAIEHSRLSKGKVYGRRGVIEGPEGNIFAARHLYADPKTAERLEALFQRTRRGGPLLQGLAHVNAGLKATVLLTSLFHHAAFVRSYMLGSRGLNPVTGYREGMKALRAFTPEVRMLVRGGLTIGQQREWQIERDRGRSLLVRRLEQQESNPSVIERAMQLYDWQTHILFGKLGPALKTQAALLELRHGLKKNAKALQAGEITAEEIAENVAKLMNADFGGLNLERHGSLLRGRGTRGKTAQHILRQFLLAPDWTESNLRTVLGMFRKGQEGALYRAFWGRVIYKGLTATMLFNLLISAGDDEDFLERYKMAWKAGRLRWLDVDVTPIARLFGTPKGSRTYFSLLGHFLDPLKWATDITSGQVQRTFRPFKAKGSMVTRPIVDVLTGTDWRGRRFTTFSELLGLDREKGRYKTTRQFHYLKGQPKWGKLAGRLTTYRGKGETAQAGYLRRTDLPSWVGYEVRQFMPIQVQNLWAWIAGELDGIDALTGAAGLRTRTLEAKRFERD